MKLLWLTFHDPLPAINGQYLYSAGLIAAVAAAGAKIDVVALARGDGLHRDGEREGSVSWNLAGGGERSRWTAPFSRTPWLALPSSTRSMRRIVQTLLRTNTYDAVVFDSICVGWALFLNELSGHRGERPFLVHIAHNHEATAAKRIGERETRPLRRMWRRLEAMKVAGFERKLVDECDFSTSNTPEDLATFQFEHPDKPIDLLLPGYSGRYALSRTIGAGVPRRAVVVGSFNWGPKRRSLEIFLGCATRLFVSAGVELHVVGSADDNYLDRLRVEYPSVVFTGRVDDVYDHLAAARIALVPDYLGGFKLKALDYVFNRVPIFSLAGSVPGLPLEDGKSVRLFSDHGSLAQAVVDLVDEIPTLNRQQEAAYTVCARLFDWNRIGQRLVEGIESRRASIIDPAGFSALNHVTAAS